MYTEEAFSTRGQHKNHETATFLGTAHMILRTAENLIPAVLNVLWSISSEDRRVLSLRCAKRGPLSNKNETGFYEHPPPKRR